MTNVEALLAFVAAASILTITPGVDTALVLRSAAVGGPRSAGYAAIGIGLGCLVWGAVVSVGLGALIAASEVAFSILKWAGAAYLLWLGVKLIVHPRAQFEAAGAGDAAVDPGPSLKHGFFTNLLNPKVGAFYITFLPQFVPEGANVASFSFFLAVVHVILGLAWFAALIAATAPLARILRRPRVIRIMDRITGGVFVAFGAKLALSK